MWDCVSAPQSEKKNRTKYCFYTGFHVSRYSFGYYNQLNTILLALLSWQPWITIWESSIDPQAGLLPSVWLQMIQEKVEENPECE